MNWPQRFALLVAAASLIVMGVYPPWSQTFEFTVSTGATFRLGPFEGIYAPIGSPPGPPSWFWNTELFRTYPQSEKYWRSTLDQGRLLAQLLLVSLVSTAIVLAMSGWNVGLRPCTASLLAMIFALVGALNAPRITGDNVFDAVLYSLFAAIAGSTLIAGWLFTVVDAFLEGYKGSPAKPVERDVEGLGLY